MDEGEMCSTFTKPVFHMPEYSVEQIKGVFGDNEGIILLIFPKKKKKILSWRLGHENISTAILPFPLIQEKQLSVIGERMCTKYW